MSLPIVSTLQLWFDANDPNSYTLSGSNITQLIDKSGNGNHSTTFTGIQPTFETNALNGLPLFNMSSAGGFSGSMQNTGTTMTVFIIAILTLNNASSRRIIDFDDGLGGDNGQSIKKAVITFTPIRLYRANLSVNSNISNINTPYLVSCYFDNTNGYLGTNGTYYTPFAVSGNFAINKYGIGLNFNNNTVYGGCKYGEVLVYNSSLSLSDRQRVEGYLAWKWGTNTSLPTNHPYYNMRFVNTPFGSIPTWLEYFYASNSFRQSYMQNFLDISGNLIIRNGSLIIANGNLLSYGNISISGTTFTNTQNITIQSGGGSNGIVAGSLLKSITNALNVRSTAYITGNVTTSFASTFSNANISVNGNAIFNDSFTNTYRLFNSIISNINITINGVFLVAGSISKGNSTISISDAQSNTVIASNTGITATSLFTRRPGNTTGNCNVVMGFKPLSLNTTGSNNTAIGYNALQSNTTGSYNTVVGSNSGSYTNGTSSMNTTIGASSVNSSTGIGYNNTCIGAFANIGNGLNTSTAIGYGAVTTANNQIVLGRTTETVYTAGLVTIGGITLNTNYKLNVTGTNETYITGDISANNIYINGGTNLFPLLKTINTGFVINATYDGNWTNGFAFSLNGMGQSNPNNPNGGMDDASNCNLFPINFIAYYYYLSCKTFVNTNDPSDTTILITPNNSLIMMSINIVNNQLLYSGDISTNNIISNIPISNSIIGAGQSNLDIYFNNIASGISGGTFWKASILCQCI